MVGTWLVDESNRLAVACRRILWLVDIFRGVSAMILSASLDIWA